VKPDIGFWTFSGWEGGSKKSLSLRNQLHKTQHGDITDSLIEKRKLSDCGRSISLPNAENHEKICQGMVESLWCIWCSLRSDAACRPIGLDERIQASRAVAYPSHKRNGEWHTQDEHKLREYK